MPATAFVERLNDQIGYEFGAHQQYVAIAVHYDAETLPRLAAFFYAQALEERNHAMMMVQYLIDADADVVIPGVAAPQLIEGRLVLLIDAPLERPQRLDELSGARLERRVPLPPLGELGLASALVHARVEATQEARADELERVASPHDVARQRAGRLAGARRARSLAGVEAHRA